MMKNTQYPKFVSIKTVDWSQSAKIHIENNLYCVRLCMQGSHKAQREFGEGVINIQENKVKVLLT